MAGRGTSVRKCSACKRTFAKELITVSKGQNFCPECYDKKEKEAQDYRNLTDYIQKLADFDNTIFPLIGRQVKSLKEQSGFTNALILTTLKYMYELKDEPLVFKPEFGIANIPYYFREAQMFYAQLDRLENTADQKIKESIECKPIQVTVNRSDIIKQQKEFDEKRKKQKGLALIDLNSLNFEDDEEIFEDKDIINHKTRLEYNQKHKYDKHTYDWGEEDS